MLKYYNPYSYITYQSPKYITITTGLPRKKPSAEQGSFLTDGEDEREKLLRFAVKF